jgi:hypothetical protein
MLLWRRGADMTRTPLLITLVVAAALAGCSKENHTIVAGPDVGDNETNVAANGPVALPPAIQSSKSYRCADNSLVYIDWMSDGTAHVKKKRDEVGVPVAPADIKGDPTASSITYKGQSCKA